ncbi:MAG TPA: HipA N-terminal domain-containing protein [Hymenobacter sp.]|nr:HipA N-terminal domain-containing protein [Hymenobacter sp.]
MKPQAAEVFFNDQLAGILQKTGQQYSFRYDPAYLQTDLPAVSLTLPKQAAAFVSPVLFSFFYGLLAEGVAKQIQCQELKIDEHDHFTRLLRTAHTETIGGVTVRALLPKP